jgi:hypothetical protein
MYASLKLARFPTNRAGLNDAMCVVLTSLVFGFLAYIVSEAPFR